MGEHSEAGEAFVAFDTSKLRNAVAIAEVGRDGEVRFFGEIANTPEATAKLVARICHSAGDNITDRPASARPQLRPHRVQVRPAPGG